jgi:hypothetical protein
MSRAGALAALAAAFSIITFAPTAAQATSATSAQLQSLVTRATDGDPAALSQLRAITSISGQPTTLGQALRFGTASEVHARLLALAGAPAAVTVSAAAAQRAAGRSWAHRATAARPSPIRC